MSMTQARSRGRAGARSGPHTALVKDCPTWLAINKIPAWPMNTGAHSVPATPGRARRFIRFAFPGCSDILGIIPRIGIGRFLAVECKTGRGVLTGDQEAFRDVILASGGVFIEARSIDDLSGILAIQDGSSNLR